MSPQVNYQYLYQDHIVDPFKYVNSKMIWHFNSFAQLKPELELSYNNEFFSNSHSYKKIIPRLDFIGPNSDYEKSYSKIQKTGIYQQYHLKMESVDDEIYTFQSWNSKRSIIQISEKIIIHIGDQLIFLIGKETDSSDVEYIPIWNVTRKISYRGMKYLYNSNAYKS